jgi:hypothetical protein
MREPPLLVDDLRRATEALRTEVQAHRSDLQLLHAQMQKVFAAMPNATIAHLRDRVRDVEKAMEAVVARAYEMSGLELRLAAAEEYMQQCARRILELERERRAERNEHDHRALLSQRQFAKRLGVSRNVVAALVREGILRTVPVPGKHPKYVAADVEQLPKTLCQQRRLVLRRFNSIVARGRARRTMRKGE